MRRVHNMHGDGIDLCIVYFYEMIVNIQDHRSRPELILGYAFGKEVMITTSKRFALFEVF